MELVSKTISGFYNGISQQSPVLRLETQGEIQENGLGTLVDGLMKRPNTTFLSNISSNATTGAYVHTISRDSSEKYIMIMTGNVIEPIEIYTNAGVKCSVSLSDQSYLNITNTPNKSYKAITVADHTYIINSEKIPAMTGDVVPGPLTDSVQKFTDLPVDGSKFTYWAGGTYNQNAKVRYNGYLYLGLIASNTATPGNATAWREEEKYATTGEIYEVSGDQNNNFDNFYVKYDGDSWNECAKPGITYKISNSNMPHKLIRTGFNTFAFSAITYIDREVGDTDSAPTPSFIGKNINNLVFFKNRLGILAGDNIILSNSGEYYDFFPTTVVDVLDDDPIDVAVSGEQVSIIYSAIAFQKSLLLFSDQQQFSLSSGDTPLSPATVAITPTTHYTTCPLCNPVAAGSSVYFISPKEQFASVREYQVIPNTLIEDAADVTAHCPSYLPSGYIQLTACNSFDMLFANTDTEPSSIYTYKFYWAGNEKPQSAWSKWTFDGVILGMSVIDTSLYIVIKRGAAVSLERVYLEKGDTGLIGFRLHLDKLVLVQGVYNSTLDRTQWNIPYVETDITKVKVVNPANRMLVLGTSMLGTTAIIANGDYSSQPFYIGKDYTFKYRMSEWYMKNGKGEAIVEGRLQMRSLTLSFTDTGYFRVEVTPFVRDTMVHTLTSENTGVMVGISNIGNIQLMSGEEKFILMAKSKQTTIDIINDSYLPCNIQSGSFEGTFVVRSRVI
jgi:hypothetical protein